MCPLAPNYAWFLVDVCTDLVQADLIEHGIEQQLSILVSNNEGDFEIIPVLSFRDPALFPSSLEQMDYLVAACVVSLLRVMLRPIVDQAAEEILEPIDQCKGTLSRRDQSWILIEEWETQEQRLEYRLLDGHL